MGRNRDSDHDIIGQRTPAAAGAPDLFSQMHTEPRGDAERMRTPVEKPDNGMVRQDTSQEAYDHVTETGTAQAQRTFIYGTIHDTGVHGTTRKALEDVSWKGEKLRGNSIHPRVWELLRDRSIVELVERDRDGTSHLLVAAQFAPHCATCLVGNPAVGTRECNQCRRKRVKQERIDKRVAKVAAAASAVDAVEGEM